MTDLDPMLREAMTRVRGPVNTRPSLTDVRRRARRRNRRRMSATVGVVACAGVGTTALIIRRDASTPSRAGTASDSTVEGIAPTTTYLPDVEGSTTTIYDLQTMTITPSCIWDALWNARNDPAGAGLVVQPADQAAAGVMPTPEQFGCTSPQCRAMFTYVVWHELALTLGFGGDVRAMQAGNPGVDFSVPPAEGVVLHSASAADVVTATTSFDTTTTFALFEGVMLIDGGAPAGAMEDAYQRLGGYDRTIVPGTGKQVDRTEVMPTRGNDALAVAVGGVFGIDGFDTWDPSFVAAPVEGAVALIVGPDYWDRVSSAATTTTIPVDSTTTSLG